MLKIITPSFGGGGRAGAILGVTVKGDQIHFRNNVSQTLGLKNKDDKIYFAFDEDESDPTKKNRLYFLGYGEARNLNGGTEPTGVPVAGKPDKGGRYIKAPSIIRDGKLQHDVDYTLLKDDHGHYIELDPSLVAQDFSKTKRTAKKGDKAPGVVPGAADQIRKNKDEKADNKTSGKGKSA